ncbi:asparagine synthase-related protein [Sphingomonas donggukensis]|uniref:Asparagine synthase-related protein n=1 Tax=Sphingomonas donggukensis TaxID=2949093 RepID=A0ABY4TT56_9SPHN|nr:asparagine synthase-related protein [Sphingomonas donggukensis]URW74896.1 asparagine synthase-related protein [Sphingomonas donggukensis]
MRSGIYALVDLSDAPIAPEDARAIGLTGDGGPVAARGHDPATPDAVSAADDGERRTILVGWLDDACALADRLGVARDMPLARLARVALDRFGADTPRDMPGEWSLFDWHASRGVTVMCAAGRRDMLLYAVDGPRVAVAPDIAALARIDWIGRTLDPVGMMFTYARYAVRRHRGDRTILARVRALPAGGSAVIDASGTTVRSSAARDPLPLWRGSFEDAMVAVDAVLGAAVERRMGPGITASMLSGGLDSSLVTQYAAAAAGDPARLVCVTSAAPPHSGLVDELPFARMVTDHLGVRLIPVVPGADDNPFRPLPHMRMDGVGPLTAIRHYLDSALTGQAIAAGATTILEGQFGEFTVSAMEQLWHPRRRSIRATLGRLGRSLLAGRASADVDPLFHVRFATHRRNALPDVIADAAAHPAPAILEEQPDGRWPAIVGREKVAAIGTEALVGGVRQELPFRDVELLRLFASFPASFIAREGMDRAPARHLMRGRLPDSIRLRPKGPAISPDYALRLRRAAPAARGRIAHFRRLGIDDWIDLDWLDAALADLAAGTGDAARDSHETQTTAVAAEFLAAWRDGSDPASGG